jgi:hypothetical protein
MIEDERDRLLSDLRKKSAAVRDIAIDSVLRKDLDPDLSFVEYHAEFERMREVAGRVFECELSVLPHAIASEALSHFDGLIGGIGALQQFSVRQAADQGRHLRNSRDHAARTFKERYDAFIKGLGPLFAYCGAAQGTDALNQMRQELEPLQQQLSSAGSEAKAQLQEIQSLVALARQGVQDVGISQHARHFANEASRHDRLAVLWLIATIVFGAALAWLSVGNLDLILDGAYPRDLPEALSQGAAKLFIFSVLASAALWCGRIYRSHQHNSVVNRHRQNALSSFQTFVSSTEDPATKNVVLVQATQSIFAPQHSGFAQTDADPVVGASAAEMARSVSAGS